MEWSIDKKPDVTLEGEAEVQELTVQELLVEVVNQLKIMNMHLSVLSDEEINEDEIL